MTADAPRRAYHRWPGGPTRTCPRCGLDKPTSEYPSDALGRPKSTCRVCRLAATQEWRARHHDELLARRRANYDPAKVHADYLRRRWSLTP
jgi:hypothetical protein